MLAHYRSIMKIFDKSDFKLNFLYLAKLPIKWKGRKIIFQIRKYEKTKQNNSCILIQDTVSRWPIIKWGNKSKKKIIWNTVNERPNTGPRKKEDRWWGPCSRPRDQKEGEGCWETFLCVCVSAFGRIVYS